MSNLRRSSGSIPLFAVAALLLCCPLSAPAAENAELPELSRRNCRAWAETAADKATVERNMKFCLWAEGESLKALDVILPIAPKSMVSSCAREVRDDDSEGLRKTLDCLNRTLQSLSDAELPPGTATLYRNTEPVRFWRLSDCLQGRQPGEACTTH